MKAMKMKTKQYEQPTIMVVELNTRGAVLLGMSTPETKDVPISGEEADTPAQSRSGGWFDED